MDKLIDFDALFEEKAAEYMKRNAGKYSEKQWEAIIPKLYREYGDTFIKKINNTPRGYFAAMNDDDLVGMLKAYLENGIPINDFMRTELTERNCVEKLLPLISLGKGEVLQLLASDFQCDNRIVKACSSLLKDGCDDRIAELAIDFLSANADLAKTDAIELFRMGIQKEAMSEILSACREKDDEIFDLLLTEFRTSPDQLPLYASCLARYGDERALPVLFDYIGREEINYLEYRELKFAIESLGGECKDERDFSEDAYYREISEQSQILPDFMNDEKKI